MAMSSGSSRTKRNEGRWIRLCRNPCRPSPLLGDDFEYDSLVLSPFQKWKLYGMTPWKCILSVILVILSTSQVKILNNYIIPYQRAAKEDWQSYLVLPDIYQNNYGFGDDLSFRIYEISWLIKQLEYTTQQYYDIENITVGTYSLLKENAVVVPPRMTMNVFASGMDVFDINTKFNNTIKTDVYDLTMDYLGPFTYLSGVDLINYVHSINEFKIEFSVENDLYYGSSNGYSTCYYNSVTQFMQFTLRGRIDMTVQPSITICEDEFDKPWYKRDIWINVILIIFISSLSFMSQILLLKAIYKRIVYLNRAKKRAKNFRWELDWKQKLKFFNVWFLISTSANIFNVLGAVFCLNMFFGIGYQSTWRLPLALTGCGCMFTWFDLVQWFQHFPKYYELILTLKMSAPRVLRFCVGVSPIFVGFAMFGVSFFSTYSELFNDLGSAAVVLFALLNGDVIHDVFVDIHPAGAFISRLYLYIFVSLFIYAVLNIFIAIVEDGFFAAREIQRREVAKHLAERKKDKADQDYDTIFNAPPLPSHFHTPPLSPQLSLADSSDFFARDLGTYDSKESLLKKSTVFSFPSPSEKFIPAGGHRVSRKEILNQRQLMNLLVTMQKSYNKDFLRMVEHIVRKSNVSVRPPHNPNYFPCDFDDCFYCILKQVFNESLKQLKMSIQELSATELV